MEESKKILQEAIDTICGPRRDAYGPAFESFSRIARMWSVYLDYQVAAHDVAMLMVLFKVCRESNKHGHDNLIDIAGYAALAEECAEYGVKGVNNAC